MRQREMDMQGTGSTEGATMHAMGINRFGGPEELTLMTVPRPTPLPTEVLVRVHAAGVNPLEWLPRPAGAHAEFVTAPSRQFARKPAAIDHDHAAGIPLAGLTAWHALTDIAHLRPGQRVLIHAAGGGVGHLAVQLARHLGAHVTATASSAKLDWLRRLGAAEVIDYQVTPFERVAQGIDVVLDRVFPLDQAAQAHAHAENGATGKTVLRTG
jgi:NADPH:quinone reductase-like Zn-dependent oxidoreductase